jgi:serine phosphatase RsbU (regulator of sigma subunit)
MTAGHPVPLLVRSGHVVGPLRGDPVLPLGLGGAPGQVTENVLEPGDRLLGFSDGMVEAHMPGGDPFGEDRLSDLLGRETLGGLDVAETTRRLIHAVLDHHAYRLGDDATLLLVERPMPAP